jgi:asparagine synthase (glutamine-hydrolysing)
MCGIIGMASVEPTQNFDWVVSGLDKMEHRGPDSFNSWISEDKKVVLGHRRLAIIDLTPEGNQPMHSHDKSLTIVFNGEIYNYAELKAELHSKGHTFYTNSDTEVLLVSYREWGVKCLAKLNGMFAFAIFDSKSNSIFVARDRAGEKPQFYRIEKGVFKFSSELKGLMQDPDFERRINKDALDCFLHEGYIPGNLCILEGVNKLPAANYLVFDLLSGQLTKHVYWDLPEIDTKVSSTSELLTELDHLLEDSVKKQMIADVPLGVLLSGGVDSSLVTAMAARSSKTVKTYTIRFPGHGKLDETEHARLIAAHFGTEHTELEAESNSLNLLPLLARQFDEPVIDSSMVPTFLVCKLIRQHCTVALGGDGADELFGGYSHYSKLLSLQSKITGVPGWLRSTVINTVEPFIPAGYKGKNWMLAARTNLDTGLPLIANYFTKFERQRLLGDRIPQLGIAEAIRLNNVPSGGDLLQKATRMDFKNYMAEDILVKVDRSSMLNSLEVRAPFLDYRIIEFAYSKVPSSLKANKGSRKIILKLLTEKLLPKGFDRNRKQGFSIPLSSWLETKEWNGFFKEVLLDKNQKIFSHEMIHSLFKGQQSGRSNGERLFGLVMFELWRKEYDIKF